MKHIKISIIMLLALMLLLSTACSKAKDLMEEAEGTLGAAEELLEEASEELDEFEEALEKAEEEKVEAILEEAAEKEEAREEEIAEEKEDDTATEETQEDKDEVPPEVLPKDFPNLLNASFEIGQMNVVISEAQTFIENEDMELPYQEGKGYLYIKGTVENNGDEAKSLGQVVFFTLNEESGDQLGNASSWIDSDGINVKAEPGAQIEFDALYMYNADNAYVTAEFKEKVTDPQIANYKVNIEDVSEESADEADADYEEMINILSLMSYDIIASIDQDAFEGVMDYSEYSFIAPSLTSNVYDGLFFEDHNWEGCLTDENVYSWGTDYHGNAVEMTCGDFFDTYISNYNFLATEPVIKQERVDFFPELSDYQATHYVKYTSGDQVCYLIYEETYFNEFILSGIAVGVE